MCIMYGSVAVNVNICPEYEVDLDQFNLINFILYQVRFWIREGIDILFIQF